MTKDIRINEPGAGEWIMGQVEGMFRPGQDHSIANYRSGEIIGGFVACHYLGNSIMLHQAGREAGWCSRALLCLLFRYVFVQLGCHKAYGPIPSDNHHAMEICLRGGWHLEAVLPDAMAPGRHLMLMAMDAGKCRWLELKPELLLPGAQ